MDLLINRAIVAIVTFLCKKDQLYIIFTVSKCGPECWDSWNRWDRQSQIFLDRLDKFGWVWVKFNMLWYPDTLLKTEILQISYTIPTPGGNRT